MDYLELAFRVEPREQGSDVLIAQLAELGFESFVENEAGFNAYIPEHDFNPDQLRVALSFYSGFFRFSYSETKIPQQNWNKEWESNFEPIEVDGKCSVRAPFHAARPDLRYDVVIEPKMSFGTGHHDTTRLMIRQLMDLEVREKSVLDMGCGTGVLAIIASMMGAAEVLAVDTDEWSYENSLENMARNNINKVLVQKGDAQILEGRSFHVILANINKNVLLTDMAVYVRAMEKGGSLVMSGFFETDTDQIVAKASGLGLKPERSETSGQWAAIHFILYTE